MPTICDDLRAAILQAAMQGKLTKQLPEDGDAGVLLEQIAEEKVKISKKKRDLPIFEGEILFEIPSSWRWQKLENISVFIGDKSNQIKESSVKKDGKHKVVSQSKELFIGYCDDDKKLLTIDDPVLVFGDHTALVKYIDFDFIIGADGVKVIKPLCVNIRFLYYALKYNLIGINELGGYSRHYKYIKDKLIPIPPLAEQKRIVKKVDELMARVADLEKSADALASLKKAFPDDIKASLLQAAMQGKLTEQLPEDGSAEDLLEEIKAEKEKLIAEGKTKKQKPLAPITDDEIPFSIPDNWKWVRLRDICTKIADGDHNPPKGLTHESEYLMLSSQNINNDTLVNMSKVRYLDKNTFEKVNERTNLQKEDILFTSVGSLGRSCIFREDINACFQRSVSVLTTLVYNEYLKLFLDSPFIQNKVYKEATGTAQKGFYLNQLEKCPIAIPPLSEQKRIVERLNVLIQNINVVGDLIASE